MPNASFSSLQFRDLILAFKFIYFAKIGISNAITVAFEIPKIAFKMPTMVLKFYAMDPGVTEPK